MNPLEAARQEGRVRNVLSQYGGEIAAQSVFFRGIRGGFSGSRVFEIISESGARYFLKQWPTTGPSYSRLVAIHDVIRRLSHLGRQDSALLLPSFACPIENRLGQTITVDGEALWEVSPKVLGTPKEPSEVSIQDIEVAMQSIAKVHLALNWIGANLRNEFPTAGETGLSNGLLRRRSFLNSIAEDWPTLASKIQNAPLDREIRSKCDSILSSGLPLALELNQKAGWEESGLPLQVCLCDLWYAHVFFNGSQVSGIIDFGSIRSDCVATDLARLLRSWIAADDDNFQAPLLAYEQIRPLSTTEREAFAWFDRTSRVLSAFQWIEWLAFERREFDDWSAVSARLDFVLARLPTRAWSFQ